uniref:PHD finger protein 7 n=1 Tax=Catharus ustulatus TaxID=91951 RepID=A0A8C3VDT5_CATUS
SWSRCQLLGHPCLQWPLLSKASVGQRRAPSSSMEALAQEPPPPGSSVGSHPAGATSCALPAAMGLPGEAPRLPLTGLLGSSQHCCVCGQSGATILCCEENCGKWFHLPCAKEGGCVNEYITPYSSFCSEHRPHQDLQVTPEPGTECPICMEPVEDRMSYRTMVCPACKRAWFHRDCIQGQAMRAGLLCFQCPLCRDSEEFILQMIIMGIRVPFRLVLPTWEDNDAFADLGERHSQCNARECLYPGGREEAEEEGPWKLLLCSSCAAEGTHRRCSGLGNHIDSWECDSCAGLGTGMRQSTWVSLVWGQCPGWAWQRLSAPGGMWAQLLPGLPWAWGASDIPVCPSRLQG